MIYADPTNNFAFHKIFANTNRPEVLAGFLNAVLQPEVPIVKVEVRNPYQESRLVKLKDTVVDVRATDRDGAEYIVEMQVEHEPDWAKRALYYTSKALVGQLNRGGAYEKLKPVFFIGVLDFRFDDQQREAPWFSRYRLCNELSKEGYPLDFQLNFIELPRFKKKLAELATDLEAWAWFFRHTHNLEEAPQELTTHPGISSALAEAKALKWSRGELEDYERVEHGARGRHLREAEIARKSLEKGLKKGRSEGFEEGQQAALRQLARRHLDQGRSMLQVAQFVGLPDEAALALLLESAVDPES